MNARAAATTRQPTVPNRQMLADQIDAQHVAIEYELAQTFRAAGCPVPQVFPARSRAQTLQVVHTMIVAHLRSSSVRVVA